MLFVFTTKSGLKRIFTIDFSLSVHDISCDVQSENGLPHISVVKQLLLGVHQLIAGLGSKLQDGVFHNGIHRASLLAVSAIDTSGSIEIVTSSSSQTIRTNFSLDVNNLGRADGLAQSAGNASTTQWKRTSLPLLSAGISSQAVLASHSRGDGDLLVGEVHGKLLSAHGHDRHPNTAEHIAEEEVLAGTLQD